MADLLSLPRELRDQIYNYLHEKIALRWYYVPSNFPESQGLNPIYDIQIEQAPLISVLLTHSRLKEEYVESVIFKRLSATLRLQSTKQNLLYFPNSDDQSFVRHPECKAGQLLRRITHLNVLVDCGNIGGTFMFPG